MRQSQIFTKTAKNYPEGEEAKNAKLLIKGGFINKSSAGVYSFLPLGLRVLNKINNIIREEINELGAEELLMPALVHKKYWEQADRWGVDVIYRTGGKENSAGVMRREDFEYGLGWTHEEVISAIAKNFINSYKDLPKSVYQIQTKFRAESRVQGGLLRGKEFLMKDLYSFHANKEDLDSYYQKVISAYKKIFKRLGFEALVTEASGGAFTKEFTHEFQVLNPAGEDTIYYCDKCGFSQNKEIFNAASHKNCSGEIKSGRAIEVGNVFKLGTKFSDAFNLFYLNKDGVKLPVIMGSYGIGSTRVMGAIVEQYNDEKGILWPENTAPFQVHLLEISGRNQDKIGKIGTKIYNNLQKSGIEVLYDERNISAGEKFADADLIGIPYRAVISEKTGNKIEIKKRGEKKIKLVNEKEIVKLLKQNQQPRQ
ncbi:MAG: prolyl-tRNA synthetase [Parcubacteria group bacterium Athens0714_26]|nr:MAG: prolyl-tRNA synthetase [Parcubacteria group bacterium Athens1014_26]TSD03548.1 MAG: prolyl-tRNA synthetase [Parcubacteria group bacterium Athens0714_26]